MFRCYLYGRKFTIVTDHKPLEWLMSIKEPNSKLVRCRLKLEEFSYDIKFKKGKLNSNADFLSRIPAEVNVNDTAGKNQFLKFMQGKNENFEDYMDEISSIIVEPGENNDQIIDDSPDDETVHSEKENPICKIPISDDPLNYAKNQIIMNLVKSNPVAPQIIKLFENSRQRIIVQIPENEMYKNFMNLVQQFIFSKISYSCHFETAELYEEFSNFLKEEVNDNIKIKKCNIILEDVESYED